MSINERLKIARETLGMTQKSVAKAFGISYRSWQDYEGGVNPPGWKAIEGLANLGININWLLSGYGQVKTGSDEKAKVAYQPDELEVRVIQAFLEIVSESSNLKEEDFRKMAYSAVDIMSFIAEVRGDDLPTLNKVKSIIHAVEGLNKLSLGKDTSLNDFADIIKVIIKD